MMFLTVSTGQQIQNNLKMTYLLEERFFGRLYDQAFGNSEYLYQNSTESNLEANVFTLDLMKAFDKMRFVLNTTEPVSLGEYFNNTPVKDLFNTWSLVAEGEDMLDIDFESVLRSYYYLGGFFLGMLFVLFGLRITFAK